MRTLEGFIRECGSRAKAAVAIGVAETTLWRWLGGRAKPRGLAVRRLSELRITGPDEQAGPRPDRRSLVARVVRVREAAEAFAKDEEEMLAGMLEMSPSKRVAEVDGLRRRLWAIGHGGAAPRRLERTVQVLRRADAEG